MAIERVRELVTRLTVATRSLVALGLALDEAIGNKPLAPAIRTEIDHVLAALGGVEMLEGVDPAALKPLLAEIRMTLLNGTKQLSGGVSAGWSHTESEILRSTGEFSAGFPKFLSQTLDVYEGLAKRLESPDGAFLDVGVGVGAISIGMARTWPLLHVVGIDPWRPSLDMARENVKAAGLEGRIELREQTAQEVSDSQTFDLAFFPSVFIAEPVMGTALARIHHALRPGGWISFVILNPGPDELSASLARLQTVLWGGHPWTPSEALSLLEQAGYVQVTMLPSGPAAPFVRIIGRRAP